MSAWNLEIFDEVFTDSSEYISIIDFESYEILYANKPLIEDFGNRNIIGEKSHKVFRESNNPFRLFKDNLKSHGDVIENWEYINIYNGEKIRGYSKVVKWIDGRNVILSRFNSIKETISKNDKIYKVEEYEKMIASILNNFNEKKDFDVVVQEVLSLIGRYSKASRTYIFALDTVGQVLNNTYEWCNDGIESQIKYLQDISCSDIPMCIDKLRKDENIIVNDIKDIPLEVIKENSILIEQEIKSIIVIPLKVFNHLYGFLGVDNVKYEYKWNGSEVETLENITGFISRIFEKYYGSSFFDTNEKYRFVFEAIANPTVILNDSKKILIYNDEFKRFIGEEADDNIKGRIIEEFIPGFNKDNLSNREVSVNTTYGKKDVIQSAKIIKGTKQIVITLIDITERKINEKKLHELSYIDELTKVYNRNKYIHDISRLESEDLKTIGLLLCDINELKFINDSIGHDYGDALIRKFADILKNSVSKNEAIYRIGGDEFVILFKNITEEYLEKSKNDIKSNMSQENTNIKEYVISAAIGSAFQLGENLNVNSLIKEADCNMYNEKVILNMNIRNEIINGFTQALEIKDYGISQHGLRLEKLSIAVAEKMGLDKSIKDRLRILAKFHDIGKIGIEDKVLFKPDKLTVDEFNTVKKHSEIGCRIARNSSVLSEVSDLILKHHERFDGDGYPLGLKEDEIPIECRILAVADAYDVITNERHYKKALSKEYAIEEIQRCSGTQFDPRVVQAFMEIIKKW